MVEKRDHHVRKASAGVALGMVVIATVLTAQSPTLDLVLSLNFDFRMTAPDPEQSTVGCQSIREAYGRTIAEDC